MTARCGATNHFQRVTIPVGPPMANLDVLILPPEDYKLQFVSSLEEQPGGKHTFWLKAFPLTNSVACEPKETKGPDAEVKMAASQGHGSADVADGETLQSAAGETAKKTRGTVVLLHGYWSQ